MSLLDIFHASKIKAENQRLAAELEEKNKLLTPEMMDVVKVRKVIAELDEQVEDLNEEIRMLSDEKEELLSTIEEHKQELFDVDEKVMLQEFALYEPKYDFVNSEQYKKQLDIIRTRQKEMIKEDAAIYGDTNWSVHGNAALGRRMVKDEKKLLLRAFNGECDSIIDRVTYSNYETSAKRIHASEEAISKLGRVHGVYISTDYVAYKFKELDLAFEYRQMKQKEKEEQKELRAQMREEAKLQREIEEARKKVEKEQNHYQNALCKINEQLEAASDADKEAILQKKAEIEAQLTEIDKNLKDIDYRESNAKAGYVYVISNIGAFGENVYKIGMTRRLDPQERVDELGDASVPFDFDVHAMIFSDNAPALEAALHKAFEDRKLNMVNQRREFFNVTLDEIKEVVRSHYDKSVEFIDFPQAEQYRTSLKMKEATT